MTQDTKKQRAEIAAAFRSAVPLLWDGTSHRKDKFAYICSAVNDELAGGDEALRIVTQRLGVAFDVEVWLQQRGFLKGMTLDEIERAVQLHRHAWLKLLIEEFSS